LSNSSVMLVLTENSWLYIGLTALMPEIICVQLRFSDNHLPDIIPEADNVFMVVDSRIIFQGEWSAFNALRMKRPDANTVWLMLEETGRLIPEKNCGGRILSQKIDTASLRLAMKGILSGRSFDEHAGDIGLTSTELSLMPYFVSDLSMQAISRLTNKSVKTLYTHRQRVMNKAGLRLSAFLKFVHQRNQEF